GFQTSPWAAALANGTNAAILDYDDNTFRAQSHLSGSLVTAALALAEARGLGGQAVLEAYLVGFEAACKIGQGVLPGQYFGGRHSTGTLGVMAATATCAKLLGLDARETATAFGIAASCAGAVRANMGTMTKGLHTGLAASSGILAVSLAARGFDARQDILEATYGYAHTTVKDDSSRVELIGEGWGNPWDVIDPGMGIKFQPSGTMSHCAARCAMELSIRHDLRPEDVEAIVCRTTRESMDIGSYGVPNTASQAMYSTPWAVAVALADRKTGLAQFSPERVQDPAVRALAARVQMVVHPDLAEITDLHDVPAAEVVVTLKDGRSLSQFRRRPIGYPGGEPWTDEMLEEKFREAAGLSLSSERVERAMALLRRFDQRSDVRELTALL
ncbi:MAG: MmgE/PrpD family protein, partial [Armatimonadetes bacterium]|nr:MmgE/PrpD family protein [Armatimonadota bacterium]